MSESTTRRAVAVYFAVVPMLVAPAWADGREGTGEKGADMALDLLVLRPLGMVATGIGSLAFVVSLPFTVPSGSVGEAACELVRKPLAYTFTRPLGDIEGGGGECPPSDRRWR